jgi:hypothetical protein
MDNEVEGWLMCDGSVSSGSNRDEWKRKSDVGARNLSSRRYEAPYHAKGSPKSPTSPILATACCDGLGAPGLLFAKLSITR